MIINLKTAKMLSIILLALCVPGSSAQGTASKLRVATRVVPPMVIEDKGALRGFSIELWNSISARLSEMALSVLAYNLTRVMNIVGTRALLAAIGA